MKRLLNLVFLPRCFGCGELLLPRERRDGVCTPCVQTVHRVRSPKCPRCALPRDVPRGVDAVCGSCLAQPPSFDRVEACWIYDGAVADAIRRSKASGDAAGLRVLAELAGDWFTRVSDRFGDDTWLVPPAHPDDLRRRGWDPAGMLAGRLTRATCRSITWSRPLRKTRRVTKQALLDREGRRDALNEAFTARSPLSGGFVVFDDVMTTGATMEAVARTLKSAGATRVTGVVIARSV